ncbi:MAG: restriction endonuclease subunit S [Planctomycetes bacterium]|nr:restriction endonuclease subunit S [Planctomycetota bacterium]
MNVNRGTEKQQKLPPGWRWAKLGEACVQDREMLEPRSQRAKALPYLSLEDIESVSGKILKRPVSLLAPRGISISFAFNHSHVLYGKLRPYLNKVALPDFEGRCTTEIIPLRPSENVDRVYLAWFLRCDETAQEAMRGKTGSRMPRADMAELLKIPIPFAPLAEQKRIAAILNEQMAAAEKARAAAEAQLEEAKALPAAYLRQVFPNEGQPLPPDWRWAKLGEICIGTGQYGLSEKASSVPQGVPILRMSNIRDGMIFWDDLKYVQLPGVLVHQYRLSKDDLLFNRTNSAELVGKSAVFDGNQEAVFASYLIRYRVRTNIVNPHFLCRYINSQNGRAFIEKNMTRAIGQVNINASTLGTMPIPLPSPNEQARITAILNEQMVSAERLQKNLKKQLHEINSLPAALLRKAFNGEL